MGLLPICADCMEGKTYRKYNLHFLPLSPFHPSFSSLLSSFPLRFFLPPLPLFFLPFFLPPFPSPSANFKVYINLSVVQQVIRFYLVILPMFLEISLDIPMMNFNPFSCWILCIRILRMVSLSRERRHILCLGVVCKKAGEISVLQEIFNLLWIMFNGCPERDRKSVV